MSYGYECLIGKPLKVVNLTADKEYVVFEFQDGTQEKYVAIGDCCSSSWIEHLELPCDVTGLVITSVKDVDMPEPDRTDDDGYDCLKAYETRFSTTKGDIVLEYRNDSNGYYGGSLMKV